MTNYKITAVIIFPPYLVLMPIHMELEQIEVVSMQDIMMVVITVIILGGSPIKKFIVGSLVAKIGVIIQRAPAKH